MPVDRSYGDFAAGLFARTSGARPRPVAAQFELTYRCNLRCQHCYTDPFNTPADLRQELPASEILRIFDELAAAGVLWLLLTGGEAVLHPDFRALYKAAKARGFVVSLFSNATVLTPSLVEFLADDPPFGLEVSLHAATAETFERVTQVPGSFQRFLEGVARWRAAGLPVKIKTKAMTLNRGELPQIQTLVESLGASFRPYTSIYPRLNGDASNAALRLTPAEVVALESSNASDEGACRDTAPDVGAVDDRLFRCGCGTNTVTISPYGVLRPCTFTVWPSADLRSQSFESGYRHIVETIAAARYSDGSPCLRCPVTAHCGKNPAMAPAEAPTQESPVPYFCDLAYAREANLKAVEA